MMGGAGDDILMSLSANGGPLTSDTPDFLSQKSLAPKTTTNLVTNPVLSNLSLPANLELNQDGDDEHIGPDVSVYRPLKDASGRLFPVMRDSKEKDDRFSINRVNAGDNSRNSIKPVEPYSFSPEKSGVESESNRFLTRPHATPLASSARTKRSSIYHPKRPSAIPIRSGSHASRAVQFDGDDRTSVKSISSSLTASFSKSFLFGFYNNYKNGGKASKSILSKEYWMKDESAKDCFSCTKSFTTFRRKHHCRICGQIFCGSCTFLIDGGKFQHEGKMRVCRNCHAHLDALDDSSDESSMEEQEDTINEESVESITKHYQPNTDVLLLKDDEVQSILTDSKGAKIFRSTPPPPPKMAIPATRQGGSLEITVPSRRSPSLYGGNTRTWRSMRDIYTIRDVDILPPYNQEDNGVRGGYNYQHIHGNTSHIPNLKNSFSSFMEKGNGGDQHKSRSHSPNSVIANLSNSDFKFEFNYGRKNFQDYLNKTPIGSQNSKYRPISRSESSPTLPLHAVDSHTDAESKYSDDCSEDERSMSLYAALNDSHQDQHYMRPTRNTTKSLQRAQASLQRMRSRGRAKNRPHTNVVRKQFEFLNNSSPYLKAPPVHENEDNTSCRDSNLCSERPSNRIEHTSSSRDMRRIISTASVLRLKSQENKTELSDVAQLHMHALLKQVLDDQDIDSLKEWIATFKPILCSLQCIRLDARNMTGLDFKQHYVKIKRIDGGSIGDSKFISGVVYSKNVPLKSMMRPLKNPRILLIMFPLEYQKSENHFMSLDSILAQEQEYLRKLVLRLKSQAPDLLLVGANVSGYALKLLDDAGIIVQFNMKPQVIERIAKLTEASIAITVDKLATNIKLGTCNRFEVRSFCYGNIVKSYSFLEGCKESLGGTVLLRGSSSEVLRKIKDITEFMVYSVFSLKSESSFFSDNFLQLSVDYYETVRSREKEPHAKGYFAAFVEKFNQRILSVSPTVQFPIPFLLQKARNLEAELSQKELEGKSLLTEPDTSKKNINKTIHDLGLESALTSQDLRNLIKFVHSKEVEDLSARFKWRSRQWELSYALSKNMLGTGTHQTINLLYTMISKKTATPCIGPQLVSIDFFWDTDISIGQFIENIVATASCPCSHGCGSLLIDHYRSYVHGTGKVDVLIEQFQSRLPSLKNVLLTWSYCKECSSSTPILQMSEKTWNYSFGKYLELLFWSRNEGIKTIGNCHHDFAKDHVKYFSYNDLMVRMEYSQVEVHELITPRSQITWKPNIDIKLKVELYYQILEKINNLYASISDRLMRIKLDSMSTERAIAGESRIIQLKKRVVVEKDHLIESTESIYRSTPGDQHLPLNVIIRFLHDHAAEWDNEFADFEKTFLPSEMDIARITAIQLKKLFTDAMKTDQDQGTLAANDDNGCVEDEDQSKLASSITKDVIQSSSTDILPKEANNYRIAQESDDSPNLGEHASLSAKQRVWETAPRPSLVHYQTVPNIKKHPQTDEASLPKDDTFLKDHRKGTINANSALLGDDGSGRLPSLELSRKKTNSSDCPRSFSACSNGSNGTMRAKEQSNSGKVGQLANFFDRIHFDALSKEFELQREFESLQLNKNRYKALRVEPSKPIVEIYKNVKDAIDGPLHTDSRKTKLPFTGMRSYAVGSGSVGEQKSSSNELETKLGRSIHQWGEQILRKEKGIQTENEVDSQNDTQAHDNNEALMPILTPAAAKMHKINPDSQPERSSLMKTLANFWADRSATLWKPLDYPTVPTEHIFVDSPVIIREDEPCSLIAFCLSSTDYLQKMRSSTSFDNRETNNTKVGPAQKKPDVPVKGSDQEVCEESQTELNLPQEKCMAEAGHPTLQLPTASENADDCSEKKSMTNKTGAPKSSLEKIMTKKTAMHLRYQFQDGNSVMSCKIFFAEQFDAFRKTCGCGDNFIQSLSRCVKWDSSGGKSGSAFLKTLDDRFVIKELSHTELDSFIKFAPSYFEYMAQAMFHDLPTALAKVFGFYQIQTKNSESGKSFKMDVIIMENLFYSKKTSRIFDLKGSMRNRHVKQTGKENEVLLDENMVEYIYESPIFVREYDKKLLRASLWNDTLFLAKMNVMDYSLVVGVDNNDHTLTVGIIDFIRTFTWDKKLESWVKERGFVGGSTKEPTVVTPRQYKNRFREAMERYILMVPDPWFQENYD